MQDKRLPSAELSDIQRFQLTVSSIRDYAIYMLDPEGYVTSWNAGAERFKGDSSSEILRASEQQFRLLVQGVTDYAICMLAPDGTVTNWNVGAQRIKDPDRHCPASPPAMAAFPNSRF